MLDTAKTQRLHRELADPGKIFIWRVELDKQRVLTPPKNFTPDSFRGRSQAVDEDHFDQVACSEGSDLVVRAPVLSGRRVSLVCVRMDVGVGVGTQRVWH